MRKKLQLFLSLCLVLFTSLGTAKAQSLPAFPHMYYPGEFVTEVTDGMKVVITPVGQTGGNIWMQPEGSYLQVPATPNNNGKYPNQWVETDPSSYGIFIIEKVGTMTNEVTGEEHDTYRIKNEATGRYLKKKDRESSIMEWTDDVEQAFECTILAPEGYPENTIKDGVTYEPVTDNPRAWIGVGGTIATPVVGGYIICDANLEVDEEGNKRYIYFCAYEGGQFLSYIDTNQVGFKTYSEYANEDYSTALYTLATALFNNNTDFDSYPVGNDVGCYSAAAIENMKTVWAEFETAIDGGATSYEACAAIYAKIAEAKATLDASLVGLEDGKYYYLFSGVNDYLNTDGNELRAKRSYTIPEAANVSTTDARFWWQVIKGEDGTYSLKNYSTGKYAGPITDENYTVQKVGDTPFAFNIETATSVPGKTGYFTVIGTNGQQIHDSEVGENSYGFGVVRWNNVAAPRGCWKFITVDPQMIENVVEKLAQERLNVELNELYLNASATYNKERIYTTDEAENDGVFSIPADGKLLSETQITSNAQHQGEGSIAALLDGDMQSYFHSAWSSAYAPAGQYHCLDLDLGEQMQIVTLKYARRPWSNQNLTPTKVNIYAANDTTNATGKWNYIGTYTLKQNVASTYQRTVDGVQVDSLIANAGGMTGFDLGATYQYVRMEVLSNVSLDTRGPGNANELGGIPYFTIAELRAYAGKFDEVASKAFMAVSEPVRNALAENLKIASAAYNEGTATREIIDNLQQAYDNFLKEFADSEVVKTALSDTKSKLNAYNSLLGEEIGMFPAEAHTAADEVVANVEAYLTDLDEKGEAITLSKVEELVAQLEAAISTLNSTLILPEVGKIYALRGVRASNSSADARGENALVYATGNGSTLKYVVDTLNEIDPATNLNYLWKVEECGNGQIALRNLATGFYLDTLQNKLSTALRNVEEKALVGYQSAMIPRGFNLIIGKYNDKDVYMNFQGDGVNMVTWNVAGAATNSNVKFVEIDAFEPETESDALYATWPTVRDGYQIMTLPFGVYYVEEESAQAYTLLGEKAGEGENNPTLELKAINDGDIIPAGTPFILQTTDTISYTMNLDAYDPFNIPYVFEVVNPENGTITGTMTGENLSWDVFGKGVFRNGNLTYISSETSGNRSIPGNSGYINYVETTETGDAFIELTGGSLTTGIAGGVIVDNNAKVNVYTISGVQVRKAVKAADATKGLPAGIYVVGGRKVIVK